MSAKKQRKPQRNSKLMEKIDALREAQGLKWRDLASAAQTDPARVSQWVNEGVTDLSPSGKQVMRMARLLGVSTEYLLDDEMEESPEPSEAERRVYDLIQELGTEESLRRLLKLEGGSLGSPASGVIPGRIIGPRAHPPRRSGTKPLRKNNARHAR